MRWLVFKAPKEVIKPNKNLKMILRWGTGFDSVGIEAAGARRTRNEHSRRERRGTLRTCGLAHARSRTQADVP